MAGQGMTWTCLAGAEGINEDSVRLMKMAAADGSTWGSSNWAAKRRSSS